MAAFTMNDPSASVPSLVEGLKLTRDALAATKDLDLRHVLTIKEQQFQDAINSAMGMELTAMAQPEGMPEPTGPGAAFAPPALMAAPVPGQTFEVRARLANRGGIPMTIGGSPLSDVGRDDPRLEAAPGWRVTRIGEDPAVRLNRHESVTSRYTVTLANDVALSTRPYFYRNGLQESRYTLSDPAQFGKPVSTAPLRSVARYSIDGVPIEIRETVRRRESKAPYGEVLREVRSAPRIAVTLTPSNAIVPIGAQAGGTKVPPLRTVDVEVTLLHNADTPSFGQLTLQLPEGWTAKPASQAFRFERAGERAAFRFAVRPGTVGARTYEIGTVAIDGLGEYRQGYELIDHRDLEVRYLYRDATATVRGVDVTTVPGLKVGYVMGVGDQVPIGLRQLGAQVTLLGERELV